MTVYERIDLSVRARKYLRDRMALDGRVHAYLVEFALAEVDRDRKERRNRKRAGLLVSLGGKEVT